MVNNATLVYSTTPLDRLKFSFSLASHWIVLVRGWIQCQDSTPLELNPNWFFGILLDAHWTWIGWNSSRLKFQVNWTCLTLFYGVTHCDPRSSGFSGSLVRHFWWFDSKKNSISCLCFELDSVQWRNLLGFGWLSFEILFKKNQFEFLKPSLNFSRLLPTLWLEDSWDFCCSFF